MLVVIWVAVNCAALDNVPVEEAEILMNLIQK